MQIIIHQIKKTSICDFFIQWKNWQRKKIIKNLNEKKIIACETLRIQNRIVILGPKKTKSDRNFYILKCENHIKTERKKSSKQKNIFIIGLTME